VIPAKRFRALQLATISAFFFITGTHPSFAQTAAELLATQREAEGRAVIAESERA
jgi:hypothetical protein